MLWFGQNYFMEKDFYKQIESQTFSKLIRILKSTTSIEQTNKEENSIFTKNHDSKFQRSEIQNVKLPNLAILH